MKKERVYNFNIYKTKDNQYIVLNDVKDFQEAADRFNYLARDNTLILSSKNIIDYCHAFIVLTDYIKNADEPFILNNERPRNKAISLTKKVLEYNFGKDTNLLQPPEVILYKGVNFENYLIQINMFFYRKYLYKRCLDFYSITQFIFFVTDKGEVKVIEYR